MEPKPVKSSSKHLKEGLLYLLILLLALSFFTPRFIEYADNRFVRAIPYLTNFFFVPVLVIILLTLNRGHFKFYFIVLGIFAQFVAVMTSATINFNEESKELETNGVWGKAVVTDKKFIILQLRNKIKWQIKCSFTANNRYFETFYESDNKNAYKVGDTLEILYNQDFPKMYRLKTVY